MPSTSRTLYSSFVGGLLLVGLASFTGLASVASATATPPESPEPTRASASAPQADDATVSAESPAIVPDFTVVSETRQRLRRDQLIDQQEGAPLLVDFWATWCAPCIDTLPKLQALHERLVEDDLPGIVGISLDKGASGILKAKRFAEGWGVSYPIYMDSSSLPAQRAFHVIAVPMLFLIDGEGRIVERWPGEPKMDEVEAAYRALVTEPAAEPTR